MKINNKYIKYTWYLLRHKWYVMLYCFGLGLYWRGVVHDLDKFIPRRFVTYARYSWRIGERIALPEGLYLATDDMVFNAEWLKHRMNNKHHWQYWVYRRPEPEKMDSQSILEMYCDWMGAMRCKGQGYEELKVWYATTREPRKFEESTLRIVDKLMQYKDEDNAVRD